MRPAFLDLMFRPNNESNKVENVTVRSALETMAWDDVTVTVALCSVGAGEGPPRKVMLWTEWLCTLNSYV